MKLYYINVSGDMEQYIAWYDWEHILTLDFTDGEVDTWNVLEEEDFEGFESSLKEVVFNEAVSKLFIIFLFNCGFYGGDYSDIA